MGIVFNANGTEAIIVDQDNELHPWATHIQKSSHIYMYICIYIDIYIKWTVFVNVTTKSAQHAHAWMIAIIVEKSPNSSHMYDHGFMDNTNRQAVKNWLNSQTSDASLTSWRQPFCKFEWTPTIIYIYIYMFVCVCVCYQTWFCIVWIYLVVRNKYYRSAFISLIIWNHMWDMLTHMPR